MVKMVPNLPHFEPGKNPDSLFCLNNKQKPNNIQFTIYYSQTREWLVFLLEKLHKLSKYLQIIFLFNDGSINRLIVDETK